MDLINKFGGIIETLSSYLPEPIPMFVNLGKNIYDLFSDKNEPVSLLYNELIFNSAKELKEQTSKDSAKKLLNHIIDCNTADLNTALSQINEEYNLYMTNSELSQILDDLNSIFKINLLEDKYEKVYKYLVFERIMSFDDKQLIYQDVVDYLNKDEKINTDNKQYISTYLNPLFMHRYNPIISLRDLFVIPNGIINSKGINKNLIEIIKDFVINVNKNVLFLEGVGGCGKSSIISHLAHEYMYNITNIDFLSGKQFIILRLRDIDKHNIIEGIKAKLKNTDNIKKDAVLVFDGLDELCMIENQDGDTIAQNIIKEFSYYQRKIVITTRPTYIHYSKLKISNASYDIVEISCFNDTQRCKMVDAFVKLDKRNENSALYLCNLPLEKRHNSEIYGSPFLIYLILSGGVTEEEKGNSWKLMHRLFHDELFNPIYTNREIADKKLAEIIYQFNFEIAFKMFKTRNRVLSFKIDELDDITYRGTDINDLVKKSHGLFSYMRLNKSGAVEFVHNHIRDYFLCEKILFEINKLFVEKANTIAIVLRLCDILKWNVLTKETLRFLDEAISSEKYKKILENYTQDILIEIFTLFSLSGGCIEYRLFNDIFQCDNPENQSYDFLSENIIKNSRSIFKIFHLHTNKDDKIHWFRENEYYNPQVIKYMKDDLSYSFFKNLQLSSIDLTYADITYADIQYAKIDHINLRHTKLSNAILNYSEILESDLTCTKFCYSEMNNVTFNMVNLSCSNFTNSKMNNANLKKTFLCGAIFKSSDLKNTSFDWSDLRCADLTFCNLSSCKFFMCNLNMTDFSFADLCDADLRDSIYLEKAIFFNTKINDKTVFPDGFKKEGFIES